MGLWSGQTIPTLEKNLGGQNPTQFCTYNEGFYVCSPNCLK